MAEQIINKVKQNTKLVNIDLQKFYPSVEQVELDIKQFLFHELLLKEKDFRDYLANHDWKQYEGKALAVFCSSDAIIAPWAYMLIMGYAKEVASEVFIGSPEQLLFDLYRQALDEHDWSQYADKFVMLKGCSDVTVPESIYALATNKLMAFSKKVMYGEACSNVPIWKKS